MCRRDPLGWMGGLAIAACTSGDANESSGTTGVDATTSDAATADGSSSGASTGSSGSDFVIAPDMGHTIACDIYADECPAGEKCMPYASDGGIRPDATRCVPLAPSPGPEGFECVVQEWSASGLDDCDRGLYCVVYDVETLQGTCTAMCTANAEGDLECVEPATCVGNPDILPRLCLTDCDPLAPACPADRGCYRVGEHFVCLDDASGRGGAYGDPCLFTNDCDPSMFCADPPEFSGCTSTDGCCTAFCDASDPEASANCPGAPEHSCVPLFAEGEGPPGLNHIGVCITEKA